MWNGKLCRLRVFEFSILLAFAAFAGLWRNSRVSKYRRSLISFCSGASTTDECLDRFRWYGNLPSYDGMMIQFWKSLDSFVAGKYADEFLYGGLDP